MNTIRIVVTKIEPGPKNVEGGRAITFEGLTPTKEPAHCVVTFENAPALDNLRAAING